MDGAITLDDADAAVDVAVAFDNVTAVDAAATLDDAAATLDDTAATLDDAAATLDDTEAMLDEADATPFDAEATPDDADAMLDNADTTLDGVVVVVVFNPGTVAASWRVVGWRPRRAGTASSSRWGTIAGVGEVGKLGKTAEKRGHVPRPFPEVRRRKCGGVGRAAKKMVCCVRRRLALWTKVGGRGVDAMLERRQFRAES